MKLLRQVGNGQQPFPAVEIGRGSVSHDCTNQTNLSYFVLAPNRAASHSIYVGLSAQTRFLPRGAHNRSTPKAKFRECQIHASVVFGFYELISRQGQEYARLALEEEEVHQHPGWHGYQRN